ncbi:MAG: TetR/AcrR family transcriptional regulator [Sphingomonadaceae bacterium]
MNKPNQTRAEIGAEPSKQSSRRGRTAVRLDPDTLPNNPRPTKKIRKSRDSQKRGDDVRLRVLQAALECFGIFGFDGTSTRAVAERAGITHTLVLYHFGSKDKLWTATMANVLDGYRSSVVENLDNKDGRPAADVLKRFIEQFIRLSAEFPQIHRIMTMEGSQNSPRLQWLVENYLKDHFIRVRDIIKQAQNEGVVRDCDSSRLFYYIIGGGGTLFSISAEYMNMTGRNVFSEVEILRNIAFIYETVFI